MPPFDLSQTLPVGGGLLVLCSLPGPPVIKQLMQMVNKYDAFPGWVVSVSVLPLTAVAEDFFQLCVILCLFADAFTLVSLVNYSEFGQVGKNE